MNSHSLRYATAAFVLVLLTACGGGSDGGGGNPPAGPSGGGQPGPSGATITIGSNGVSPNSVTISVGQSVTFVNTSGSSHDMESDPHPAHTDCPVMEAVGLISNGQTKLTNAFTTARTCGFHDHNLPDTNSLKGTIRIQ
jgi:plastocyanin